MNAEAYIQMKEQQAEAVKQTVLKEIKEIRKNFMIHGNRFLELSDKIKPVNGCYNVGISNRITGETKETQGDITNNSWSGFYEWLLGDMNEAGIGHIKDLEIDYIEYAGKENMCA